MVINKYNLVTHELTKRLTDLILEGLKSGKPDVLSVYKSPHEALITVFTSKDDAKLQRYGYAKLLDTSAINNLVRNTPHLQTKTHLEPYLYNVLKKEEHRLEEVLRAN